MQQNQIYDIERQSNEYPRAMFHARHKKIFMVTHTLLGGRIIAIICYSQVYMGGEWVMM